MLSTVPVNEHRLIFSSMSPNDVNITDKGFTCTRKRTIATVNHEALSITINCLLLLDNYTSGKNKSKHNTQITQV